MHLATLREEADKISKGAFVAAQSLDSLPVTLATQMGVRPVAEMGMKTVEMAASQQHMTIQPA